MTNKHNQKSDPGQPTIYQIRIKGHLGRQWIDWFEGLTITHQDDGDTLITGPVVDQAALHGLIKKVRDLGMPLVSVNCDLAEAAQPAVPDVKTELIHSVQKRKRR